MRYYTGIGARKTPKEILNIMCQLGYILADNEMILRSGGAIGADSYFQLGCQEWCKDTNTDFCDRQEIIIPWEGFNNNYVNKRGGITMNNHWLAHEITMEIHPNSENLTQSQIKLMNRNVTQVYGNNGIDSDFVVCWTPDGAFKETGINTGGTGQAIRLALESDIPVINLKNKTHLKMVLKWIENNEI